MKARILAMCVSSAVALAASSVMAAPSAWWAPYTTDANTVGLWHFDDVTNPTPGSTFADSSGNSNTGTFTTLPAPDNGVQLTTTATSGAGTGPGTGLFGTSLKYSATLTGAGGATGYQWGTVSNSGAQFAGAPAFTIEAWINPSTDDLGATTESYFAGNRSVGGWNIGLYQSRILLDDLTNDGNVNGSYRYIQSTATFSAGTWYHVAVTAADNGSGGVDAKVYVNGVLDSSTTWAGTQLWAGYTGTLNIGNRGGDTEYSVWKGGLDEVRYSDIARTFGPAPVPEPASIALFGAIGAMALVRRRRR